MPNLENRMRVPSREEENHLFERMDLSEKLDAFKSFGLLLEDLSYAYDKGEEDAERKIAEVLYKLLCSDENRHGKSLIESLVVEKENNYNIKYVSSAFPRPQTSPFIMGWHITQTMSGISFPSDNVYAGLIIKTLRSTGNNQCVLEYNHKANRFSEINKELKLSDWLKEIILANPNNNETLSRREALVATAYGNNAIDGADLFKKYKKFANPRLFNTDWVRQQVAYKRNPVSASVRQIAWEVLESFKKNNLFKSPKDSLENNNSDSQINQDDFLARMEAQRKKGLSAPLSGKGTKFIMGILAYAMQHANRYVYFYLPTIYQDAITKMGGMGQLHPNLDAKGIFFKTVLDKDNKPIDGNPNIKTVDVSKFPFIIFDDEYYALEYPDDTGNKVWVAILRSSDNVSVLKEFFNKLFDAGE